MFDPPRTEAGEALAVVELSSIARAFRVADAMMKRAPSVLWSAGPMSPGHFLILLTGGVAEVDESYRAGLEVAGEVLIDHVMLPQIDRQLAGMLYRPSAPRSLDALGVVETTTCAATVRGADAALKCADVALVHLLLGRGIGGKGVFAFSGTLPDVQASLMESLYACREDKVLVTEEIAAPHAAMGLKMLGAGTVGAYY